MKFTLDWLKDHLDTSENLNTITDTLTNIGLEIESVEDKSEIFNTEYIEMLELKNLIDNSLVTMHSANFRKESRGAHSHEDYQERDDDNWLFHTIADLKKGDVEISTRDVIREVLDNEVKTVPLAKRVY